MNKLQKFYNCTHFKQSCKLKRVYVLPLWGLILVVFHVAERALPSPLHFCIMKCYQKIPPKLPARQAKYCTSLHSFSKIKVIITKKSICFKEIIKLFSKHQLTWQVSIHSLVTAIFLSATDHYLQCININCTVVLFSA